MNLYNLHRNPQDLVGYGISYYTITKQRAKIDGEVFRTITREWMINGQTHRIDGPATVTYRYRGHRLYDIEMVWQVYGERVVQAHCQSGTMEKIDHVFFWGKVRQPKWKFTCPKPAEGDAVSLWNNKPLTWRTTK